MHAWVEVAPGLRLTGDGAGWLVEAGAVVIADVHVGYARAARRRGGWLPEAEPPDRVAGRALAALDRCGAGRLVIAGDLRHSTRDADAPELADVERFLAIVGERAEVVVVAGNHDRGSPAPRLVALGDVDVTHEPPAAPPARWTVCGHLHPVHTVRDETGAGARFRAALVGERVLVLPAFGAWAGGTEARRLARALPGGPATWRALVVSDGVVVEADDLTTTG
ncbi:MAG TPA: hypothetical protein VNA89_16710 [Gemmatimonadaceae bacterium]|nr:hypothetical protein [Gemmatimonadaceae bacterium]